MKSLQTSMSIIRKLRSLISGEEALEVPLSSLKRSFVAVPVLVGLLTPQAAVMEQHVETQTDATEISATTLTTQLDEKNLPIGEILIDSQADDWGTVIFFPQYHRYPGSSVSDSRNDLPKKTQEEMYDILQEVVQLTGVDAAFVEGEHVGTVDTEKRDRLKQQVMYLEAFRTHVNQLPEKLSGKVTEEELAVLTKDAQNTLAYVERSVALSGAAERVWVGQDDMKLFGTENPETKEKGRQLVRDYIYLQDRLGQLSGVASLGKLSNLSHLFPASMKEILLQKMQSGGLGDASSVKQLLLLQLMQRMQGEEGSAQQMALLKQMLGQRTSTPAPTLPSMETLNRLKTLQAKLQGEENTDAASFVGEFQLSWEQLMQTLETSKTSSSTAPSRSDNPYAGVTDVNQVKKLMKENQQQIQEVIVEQRNVETAEHVAEAMKQEHESVAVLQYGAGHQEGMIEELRARGLSVITIVPQTVYNERLTQ